MSQGSSNTRYTGNPQVTYKVQASSRKTDAFRIEAKHHSFQPIVQSTDVPRAAAKLPSHQHTPAAALTNQFARSTNEAFLSMQNDVPQP